MEDNGTSNTTPIGFASTVTETPAQAFVRQQIVPSVTQIVGGYGYRTPPIPIRYTGPLQIIRGTPKREIVHKSQLPKWVPPARPELFELGRPGEMPGVRQLTRLQIRMHKPYEPRLKKLERAMSIANRIGKQISKFEKRAQEEKARGKVNSIRFKYSVQLVEMLAGLQNDLHPTVQRGMDLAEGGYADPGMDEEIMYIANDIVTRIEDKLGK
jgi:hypothetical protein